jgi:hypothetical protein
MQHGITTRLCFIAASWVFATTVWASDTRLWGESNDYVQLEAANTANQHPVTFSAEQLNALLGHFYKRVGDKEPLPYFSQDEISRIAPDLVRLFAKAKPGEDVDFGTSFRASGFFLVPRTLNAGRLFVENGQLNLLIGMCAAEQDVGYQQAFGKYRELNHGSRNKAADKLGCELLAGNDTERVDNRTDWLRLNINAALTTKAVPTFLPTAKALTFGSTGSPVQATAPPPTSLPAPATRPAEAIQPALQALPASDAEERLVTLKRLHDKGLITDTEYEQKRAAVLKSL